MILTHVVNGRRMPRDQSMGRCTSGRGTNRVGQPAQKRSRTPDPYSPRLGGPLALLRNLCKLALTDDAPLAVRRYFASAHWETGRCLVSCRGLRASSSDNGQS